MFQKTKLVFESVRDGLRRAQFFGTFREPKNLIQAKAELQKDIHLLERALALPEPRRPFGNKPAARITSILNQHGDALGDYLIAEAHRVLQDRNNWNESGVRPLPLEASGKTSVEKFLSSRRSVRAFGSDRRPTEAELNGIIELAMQAPVFQTLKAGMSGPIRSQRTSVPCWNCRTAMLEIHLCRPCCW